MPAGPQPVFRSHVSDMALQASLIRAPVYTCVLCTAVPVGSHGALWWAVCGVEGPGMSFTSRARLYFCYYVRSFRERLNVDSSQEPQCSSVEGHAHLLPASSPATPPSWASLCWPVSSVTGPHLYLVAGAGPSSCVMGIGPPVRAPTDGTVVHPCCRCVHVSESEVMLNCFVQGGWGLCPEGPQVSGHRRHIASDAPDLSWGSHRRLGGSERAPSLVGCASVCPIWLLTHRVLVLLWVFPWETLTQRGRLSSWILDFVAKSLPLNSIRYLPTFLHPYSLSHCHSE